MQHRLDLIKQVTNVHYCCFALGGIGQLIFRKVSDMKREKELAERRKNEPQLDHSQDHLVRKIFSRFRKGGGATSTTNLFANCAAPSTSGSGNLSNGPSNLPGGNGSSKDVEKGEGSSVRSDEIMSIKLGPPLGLTSKVAKEQEEAPVRSAPVKSKWGRLLRSSASETEESQDPLSTQSLLPKTPVVTVNPGGSSKSGSESSKPGSGNKVYPKLSRVPERQEAADEAVGGPGPERVQRPHLTVQRAVDQPPTVGTRTSELAVDYNPPKLGDVREATGQKDRSESPNLTPSIIGSFMDLKQEVRSEVQRINHKMTRLEDILGEILVRLTPPPAVAAPAAGSSSKTSRSRASAASQAAPTDPSSASSVAQLTIVQETRSHSTSRERSEDAAEQPTPVSGSSRSAKGARKSQSDRRPKSAGPTNLQQQPVEKISATFKEYV